MGSYVPNTKQEQQEMLREIGFESFDEMFSNIPEGVKLKVPLELPAGLSEQAVIRKMEEIADQNVIFKHIFRGAGAYHHYIPAIVSSVVSKEEFLTAYTPYQAEISQGILQSIFEYQTMICQLTGMDAANASVYDGATAAAEAVAMCRDRKRSRVYLSEAANPQVIQVIKTYCYGSNTDVAMVPEKDGITDVQALETLLKEDKAAACFYVQQPNFYGMIEDGDRLGAIVHEAGAKFIMGCNPLALSIMKTPAEYGADIAVGDGQPLGMPLAFGGPYLGFMAAGAAMMRKLPGRIVGETKDSRGNRAFVLTLQAREQHIRREKASSNICSNQALCALTAAAYMTAMGAAGMEEAAKQCMAKAHYLCSRLEAAGLHKKYGDSFFHEFVTVIPEEIPADSAHILKLLEEHGILGGLPLSDKEILWCATEMNTREEMDQTAELVGKALLGASSEKGALIDEAGI
ncbi:MAG: aminomethyl-transferring glycine dehydrogenase subunit GcvPA [Lachnospiraceae bacterium]|nr:aminomethyl-transferring glycine dehydrogenase subunit GcvPA [Lachnospiraceae bacterium]